MNKKHQRWYTYITIVQIFDIKFWFWLPQECDNTYVTFLEEINLAIWGKVWKMCMCHSSWRCDIRMTHVQSVTPVCHFPSLVTEYDAASEMVPQWRPILTGSNHTCKLMSDIVCHTDWITTSILVHSEYF